MGFLWSLGYGDDARGYGKTRHLLWFAKRVNADFGECICRSAGRSNDGERLLAAYAAFSTVEGLTLNNLLFDVVRDLIRSHGQRLVSLRAVQLANGRSADHLYGSAATRIRQSGEGWSPGLLSVLSFFGPEKWAAYIESFSQWHKVRFGRQMLRACVAFLLEIGIHRLLILVDQVEDFASYTTPAYKLRRDFARLASLCSVDQSVSPHVRFVLTMHPNAARILSKYWSEEALGPVSGGEPAQNVVMIGAMNKNRFRALVKMYLASVRVESTGDALNPFTEDAIEFVYELQRGRPGYCLQHLYVLLNAAAAEGSSRIDKQFVQRCLAEA